MSVTSDEEAPVPVMAGDVATVPVIAGDVATVPVIAGDVAIVPITAGARRAPAERPRRTLHRQSERG